MVKNSGAFQMIHVKSYTSLPALSTTSPPALSTGEGAFAPFTTSKN